KMLVYITAITVPLFILIFCYHALIVPQLGPQPSEPFRIILEQIYIIVNGGTILLAGFHLMKNPAILKEQIIQKEKPEKISEAVDENIQKLHQLIEDEKVHLDHNLSEKLLAEKLGIQAYLLSRLLNDHLGMTFRQFVNEKRIGFAKELLSKPENHDLTIFAVAVDSGFNSESVFYVNFKKYTGMTPTQFKKECIRQHKLSKETALRG
ncbi:MAG: AraC family transcriptional regulator, partial [Bacteroidota bacterium]